MKSGLGLGNRLVMSGHTALHQPRLKKINLFYKFLAEGPSNASLASIAPPFVFYHADKEAYSDRGISGLVLLRPPAVRAILHAFQVHGYLHLDVVSTDKFKLDRVADQIKMLFRFTWRMDIRSAPYPDDEPDFSLLALPDLFQAIVKIRLNLDAELEKLDMGSMRRKQLK